MKDLLKKLIERKEEIKGRLETESMDDGTNDSWQVREYWHGYSTASEGELKFLEALINEFNK